MSRSTDSPPLRLRIRPSRPLAAEPFLLPVLGGGESSLSDLADQIANALSTHGASASSSSQTTDTVTGHQLALYLDGFRLLDWRYRVRDTLRDGDVLSVYHVSKLPITITIDSSDEESQRAKSKRRTPNRKRKYRSSSQDSDSSSDSTSRARRSKKTRQSGSIRIKQEKFSDTSEPSLPSSDQHIQAEADRIALLIKSEIGPSPSPSSSRPPPLSRQIAQADNDDDDGDDLPKPPPGLMGRLPARPAATLPVPGPSSAGAAAAMQAFEARKREQAKAQTAKAEESSEDNVSSQDTSSEADDSESDEDDSNDDSNDDSDDDSDDSDSSDSEDSSSSSLAQVEDLVARQPSVGNEAKRASDPPQSAVVPAVPHQIASDVKSTSSSSSQSSSSSSDSSEDDDSDSDEDSDSDSVSDSDSDSDSDSQSSSSSASSSSTSDSSESVDSQRRTRRLATPPGGWVPPGQGSSRTRQKNQKNRQKAKEKRIAQREVELLAAQQRVAEDSIQADSSPPESSKVNIVGKVADSEAAQAPRSPVLSSAHSDSSSSAGWVLDTAPTIPHTPYQARYVAQQPTGIPQQILYQTQQPSSSSTSTAPQTLSEREAQIAALRQKIEKAEQARRLAQLQRQQSEQLAQASGTTLPSSFQPIVLPGTLPPGAGALDVDFAAAASEAEVVTKAERDAAVTSQEPLAVSPQPAVAEEDMPATKKPSSVPGPAKVNGTSPSPAKENSKTRRLKRRLAAQLQQEQQKQTEQAGGMDKIQHLHSDTSAAWSTPGSSFAPAPAPNPSSRPSHEIPSNIRLSSVDCQAWSQGRGPRDYLYIPSGQEGKFVHRRGDSEDSAPLDGAAAEAGETLAAAALADADEYADDPTQDEQTRQYLAMQRNVKAQLKREKELERLKEAAKMTHEPEEVSEELKRRDEELQRLREAARLSHAAKAKKQQKQAQAQAKAEEQAQQASTSAIVNGTEGDLLHPDLPLEFKSFNTRVGGVVSANTTKTPSQPAGDAGDDTGTGATPSTSTNGKSSTADTSTQPPTGPKSDKRSSGNNSKTKKHLDQNADATSGMVLDYGDADEDESYAEQRRKRTAAAAAKKQQQQQQKQMDTGGGVMPTSVQV